jgi:hypothetical protein
MEPVSWRLGFAPPATPLTRRLLVYFRSGAYTMTKEHDFLRLVRVSDLKIIDGQIVHRLTMIVHGDNVKVQQPEIWRIVASDSRQGEGHRDHDPEFHGGFHPLSATGMRLYHARFILSIHSYLFHTPQLVFPYVIVEYALVMCLAFA